MQFPRTVRATFGTLLHSLLSFPSFLSLSSSFIRSFLSFCPHAHYTRQPFKTTLFCLCALLQLICLPLHVHTAATSAFAGNSHSQRSLSIAALPVGLPNHLIDNSSLHKRDPVGCTGGLVMLAAADGTTVCIKAKQCEKNGLRVNGNHCVCVEKNESFFAGLCSCEQKNPCDNNLVLNSYRNMCGCPNLKTIHIDDSCVPRTVCTGGLVVDKHNVCVACNKNGQKYSNGMCRPQEKFAVKVAKRLITDPTDDDFGKCKKYQY